MQLALPLQQLKIEMPLHPLNKSSALHQHARVLECWLHNSASSLEIPHHSYPQLTNVVHLNLQIYDIRIDARADIRERNLKIQEAMAAESILSSKRKRAKANFTMLNSKIKVLEKYKDAYVEEHGEENYKKKLQELINALMASGEPDELPAPQMDKDEQMDKDDEDSDDNDNNDDHGS